MRVLSFLLLGLLLRAFPVAAQDDAALFRVADVTVEVTAASASVARDHAIMEAQRTAVTVLLKRLGVSDPQAKPTNEALAALVQAFDLHKEHAAGLHYTGTFSVQFKPSAVRQWLDNLGVPYTENRALPVVVLPVVKTKEQTILWEDATPWHNAWSEVAKTSGLIPFIVPAGELGDISLISTNEALEGKKESLQAVMKKYGATAALVSIFEGDASTESNGEGGIETRLYDVNGERKDLPRSGASWTVPTQKADSLTRAIHKSMDQVEDDWRESNKAPSGAVVRLPCDVAVPTLAAFAQIKQRLAQIPAIADAQVISMTRGLVHIELSYRGELPALQEALTPQNLALEQGMEGGWILRQTVVE